MFPELPGTIFLGFDYICSDYCGIVLTGLEESPPLLNDDYSFIMD